MKRAWQFFASTLLAGTLLMVPLMLLLYVAREVIALMARLLDPVAKHPPFDLVLGLRAPDIVAAFLLIVSTFLGGLLARTTVAREVTDCVEHLILRKLPGDTLLKRVARGAVRESSDVTVALAHIDEAWLLSCFIEKHPGGLLTVFSPSAPTPTAGSVYFLQENQMKRLNVPVSSAMKCLMQLGVGSVELLGAGFPMRQDLAK